MDRTQVELFYLGEDRVPAGALVMVFGDHEFTCQVTFSTPDGGRVASEGWVRMNGVVTDWTDFTFVDGGVTARGSRDGTSIRVGEELAEYDGTVVPSYAASLLVLELVSGPDDRVEFMWLEESAASASAVRPARLVAAGIEDVDSPVAGALTACQRVELTVNGDRTNTYWVRDGVMVATDWNGARSFALSQGVADNLRAALGLTT